MDVLQDLSYAKVQDSKDLSMRFNKVRALTMRICQPLLTDDYVVQPVVDVSPPKWHLGHTTWFFENFLLAPHYSGYKLFDKRYNYIFNSYYETEGERVKRTDRGNLTRPSTEAVKEYRQYVDTRMEAFLGSVDLNDRLRYILELGLHHEQQHQELLVTDLKFILGNNPLMPAYSTGIRQASLPGEAIPFPRYLPMEEGVYEIGHEGDAFCFDNEKGRHKVFLHAYGIMDRLVTNGEYIEFIDAAGYADFRHWLAEGWDWVKANRIASPLYWFRDEGAWHHYTLRGPEKVDPASPVTHISFYEADAYAKWKGKRLPTEQEWEAACNKYHRNDGTVNQLDSWNLEPLPPEAGFQFIGDAWEWTNSAYLPYPYYERMEGALGEYNGKFMINQMVLRGGSCATPAGHIRSSYRNFFPPEKQWQFSGIRLAEYIR